MANNIFGKIVYSRFFVTSKGDHRMDFDVQLNKTVNPWDRQIKIRICVFAADGFEPLWQAVMNGKMPKKFAQGTKSTKGIENALVGSFWGFSVYRKEETFTDRGVKMSTYKIEPNDESPMTYLEKKEQRFGYDFSQLGVWMKPRCARHYTPMNDIAKEVDAAKFGDENAENAGESAAWVPGECME